MPGCRHTPHRSESPRLSANLASPIGLTSLDALADDALWAPRPKATSGSTRRAEKQPARVLHLGDLGPSSLPGGNASCPTSSRCSAFPICRALGFDVYRFD